MKQGDPSKLKTTFTVKNEFIKSLNSKCCEWGMRLPNTKTRGTLGSPAPLWMNMSENKYKLCYIVSLLSSLTFIVFYIVVVVYNANVQASVTSSASTTSPSNATTTNTTDTDTLNANCLTTVQTHVSPIYIIIGSSILFVNGIYILILLALMARFMHKLPYASDEEWFRYLVIFFGCTSGLFGFIISDFFQFESSLSFYNTSLLVNYPTATQCIILFKVDICIELFNIIAIAFVSVFQAFLILYNFLRFFYFKMYHIARYEDKDIEVYSF